MTMEGHTLIFNFTMLWAMEGHPLIFNFTMLWAMKGHTIDTCSFERSNLATHSRMYNIIASIVYDCVLSMYGYT